MVLSSPIITVLFLPSPHLGLSFPLLLPSGQGALAECGRGSGRGRPRLALRFEGRPPTFPVRSSDSGLSWMLFARLRTFAEGLIRALLRLFFFLILTGVQFHQVFLFTR